MVSVELCISDRALCMHPLQDGQIDLFKNIQIQGKLPHYSHLMFDKYRKVFYRFALMPDDNIKPLPNMVTRWVALWICDSLPEEKTLKTSELTKSPATISCSTPNANNMAAQEISSTGAC